jgi:Leucine-rich repeat (LRR) protein
VGERLDLRERGLSAVPHEVWEARGLRSLALGRNPLGAVPDAVGSLTSLIALYLDETGLQELPEAIGCLERLRVLDVAHNRLRALPDGVARRGPLPGRQPLWCVGRRFSLRVSARRFAAA